MNDATKGEACLSGINCKEAVRGKSKGEVDHNAVLDGLQRRELNDDNFQDKMSKIAMKQADGLVK